MKLFDIWFKNVAAQKTLSYEERNAVFFSTVGKDMKPSSRTVLLQAYDVDGFSIYTSYDSRKARELQENPNACMLVRVEGKVSKFPKEAAIEHWNSLPLAIRIVLKSNEQSAVIPNEEYLENKRRALQELAAKEGERSITKPEWVVTYSHQIMLNFGKEKLIGEMNVWDSEKMAKNGRCRDFHLN
ncbi:pyridoxamine 5'-phosphate oxidase family protein [Cooperia oncophora]